MKLTVQVSWPVPAMSVAQSVAGTHETDEPEEEVGVREMEVVKRGVVVDLELVGALRQGAAVELLAVRVEHVDRAAVVVIDRGRQGRQRERVRADVPSGGSVELMRKTLLPLPWPMT